MKPFTCKIDLDYVEHLDLCFLLEWEIEQLKKRECPLPHDKKTLEVYEGILAKINAAKQE